jgi:hypothetical protein
MCALIGYERASGAKPLSHSVTIFVSAAVQDRGMSGSQHQ